MQLRPLKVATLTRSPPPWGRFARESSGLPDRGPPQAVGEVLRHIDISCAARFLYSAKIRHYN